MLKDGFKIDRLGFGNKIGERVSNASFIGSFLLLGAGLIIKGMTQFMLDPSEYVEFMNELKENGEAHIKRTRVGKENSEQA